MKRKEIEFEVAVRKICGILKRKAIAGRMITYEDLATELGRETFNIGEAQKPFPEILEEVSNRVYKCYGVRPTSIVVSKTTREPNYKGYLGLHDLGKYLQEKPEIQKEVWERERDKVFFRDWSCDCV